MKLRIPRKIVQTDFPFESVTRNTEYHKNCAKKFIKVLQNSERVLLVLNRPFGSLSIISMTLTWIFFKLDNFLHVYFETMELCEKISNNSNYRNL